MQGAVFTPAHYAIVPILPHSWPHSDCKVKVSGPIATTLPTHCTPAQIADASRPEILAVVGVSINAESADT